MSVPANLILGTILFCIGIVGFLSRRNLLVQLMSIEIMLNAVNVILVAFNRLHTGSLDGQVFAFFVIAIAAAEAAVGLALLIAFYRLHKHVESDEAKLLSQ